LFVSYSFIFVGVNLRTGCQGIFPAAHAVDVDYTDFDPLAREPPAKKDRFLARYLGSVETSADYGPEAVSQCIAKVKGGSRLSSKEELRSLAGGDEDSGPSGIAAGTRGPMTERPDIDDSAAAQHVPGHEKQRTCVLEVSEEGIRMVGNRRVQIHYETCPILRL
jgi:hypothetical protein